LSGAACFGASRALHTVTKVVDRALDSLPQNFAGAFIMSPVEDLPPKQPSPEPGQQRRLLGGFQGVPHNQEEHI